MSIFYLAVSSVLSVLVIYFIAKLNVVEKKQKLFEQEMLQLMTFNKETVSITTKPTFESKTSVIDEKRRWRNSFIELMDSVYACYDSLKNPVSGELETFESLHKKFHLNKTTLFAIEEIGNENKTYKWELMKKISTCEKKLLHLKQQFLENQMESEKNLQYEKKRHFRETQKDCLASIEMLANSFAEIS
ncbi:hypothetical protein [Enterococcus rivorum]|uniref:Uncharacterized protein n=1 Tax=Enterococcus rivorum TaxID=762845 RepID=A0A1E5KY22_9ENTE|nr:hypothetical protein [Enterococcus rivorum]MBP2099475.1 hypothetical protein [Enterococcus rivorum]OEH82589.1 hypothetical protein BCR26_12660 [Enterococcus rivorum]